MEPTHGTGSQDLKQNNGGRKKERQGDKDLPGANKTRPAFREKKSTAKKEREKGGDITLQTEKKKKKRV